MFECDIVIELQNSIVTELHAYDFVVKSGHFYVVKRALFVPGPVCESTQRAPRTPMVADCSAIDGHDCGRGCEEGAASGDVGGGARADAAQN